MLLLSISIQNGYEKFYNNFFYTKALLQKLAYFLNNKVAFMRFQSHFLFNQIAWTRSGLDFLLLKIQANHYLLLYGC